MAMTAATDVGYVHDAKKPRDVFKKWLDFPGYRDACANVKFLGAVTFADAPGRDTRPSRADGVDCAPDGC